jgi:hypothetical protein
MLVVLHIGEIQNLNSGISEAPINVVKFPGEKITEIELWVKITQFPQQTYHILEIILQWQCKWPITLIPK